MAESTTDSAPVTVQHLPVSDRANRTPPRSPVRRPEVSPHSDSISKDSNLTSIATAGLIAPPQSKSIKRNLPSDFDPPPLTAAAALADERRLRAEEERKHATKTSPNPARSTMNMLLGRTTPATSKIGDAPSPKTTAAMPTPTVITNSAPVAEPAPIAPMQTSPTSMSSQDAGSLVSAGGGLTVESPIAMESRNGLRGIDEERSNKAVTYPPPRSTATQELRPVPPRGMSLPDPGYGQDNQRSNSTKKHKCPYCDTDFTRHHNLKSHLLTHSQEKPFVCQTCNMRFRRSHDLKRHTKLHTGERSHMCHKCGRKFARGDALARHNKGQAGCAGQRASMGGDDEYGDNHSGVDDMEGVSYQNGQDEHGNGYARRRSEPGSKNTHSSIGSGLDSSPNAYRHPTTYPGSKVMQATNRAMQPPNAASSAGLSPRSSEQHLSPRPAGTSASSYMNAGGQSVFAHSNMTESPLPLSPGQSDSRRVSIDGSGFTRRKSPPRQTHRLSGYGTPPTILPPMSLPQPLPSLTSLAPDQRQIAPLQSPSSNGRGSFPGPITAASGGSSSHHSSGSSLREHLGGGSSGNELWDHVRRLENKLMQMQDEMTASLQKQQNQYEQQIQKLQDELDTMKSEKAKQV